ncbi:MAG: hypothetical protein J2P18_12385, partial [Nocardia sp.]|nr:hypothetical protein [Nocardia sp.]
MARNEDRIQLRQRLSVMSPFEPDGRVVAARSAGGGLWDRGELGDRGGRDIVGGGADSIPAGLRPAPGAARESPVTADPDLGSHEPQGPHHPQWLTEPVGSVTLWHRLIPDRLRAVRWDPGRRGVWVLAALGILALVVAATAAQRDDSVVDPVAPLPAVRTGSAAPGGTGGAGPDAGAAEPTGRAGSAAA